MLPFCFALSFIFFARTGRKSAFHDIPQSQFQLCASGERDRCALLYCQADVTHWSLGHFRRAVHCALNDDTLFYHILG